MMARRRVLGLLIAVLAGAVLGGGHRAASASGIWVCTDNDCQPYRYDPAVGDPHPLVHPDRPIAPGTPFARLPETWRCPLCGAPKPQFEPFMGSVRQRG